MVTLRSIIFWIVFTIFTLIYAVIFVIGGILFFKYRHFIGVGWARSFVWLLKHIIGLDYRVIGTKNIPTKPTIIASKHQSSYETLILQMFLPHQVFVMKRELLYVPIVGQGLMCMSPIAINRSKRTTANRMLLEIGTKRKESGFWITIFPEGTRAKPGEKKVYKRGGARMARILEMDLLPIGVNSGEFWPKGGFVIKPGIVTFVVGQPISYTLGDEAQLTDFLEYTVEKYQQWITYQDTIDCEKIEKLLDEEFEQRKEAFENIRTQNAEKYKKEAYARALKEAQKTESNSN